MFCSKCGARLLDAAKFCGQCGTMGAGVAEEASTVEPPARGGAALVPVASRPGSPWAFTAAGILVGAVMGFILRPSVPLLGQLPIETVMTRGASLSGLEQLLVPTAQQSFNVMLTGAVLGALFGLVLFRTLAKGRG